MVATLGWLSLVICGSLAAQPLPATHVDDFVEHPRVVVISDIVLDNAFVLIEGHAPAQYEER